MKKAAVCAFTKKGFKSALKICEILKNEYNVQPAAFGKAKEGNEKYNAGSLSEWTKHTFFSADVIIFVSAAGIAVRSIAPYIKDKFKDPCVLVCDEALNFAVPILSGHVGGGNDIARFLEEKLGITAVITTSTDVNNKFAVDVFAVKNKLFIESREMAKYISAEITDGKKVGFFCDGNIKGDIPKELSSKEEIYNISVSVFKKNTKNTLCLVPKAVSLGIGCRRNTPKEKIERAVIDFFSEENIFMQAVEGIYSIDLKKDEKGLIEFIKENNFKSRFFSAEELKKAEGNFAYSSFVKSITGVDNVCQRAAVCGSRENIFLTEKRVYDGVTISAAVKKWGVKFE